jgi:hypothetical protein
MMVGCPTCAPRLGSCASRRPSPNWSRSTRCFDSWAGLGLLAVGLARQGYWLSLSHIAQGEWQCYLMGDNAMLAPKGYGVAPTPWAAVQMAG